MSNQTPIVTIVGRTNVGKSSLYNAILNRREAIVAREAGTTRDSLMTKAYWKDKEFWLVDTAGLKDPADEFELTIQEQIYSASESSDVILVVVEADVPINDDDRKLIDIALKSKKPVMLVINKIDKVRGLTDHVDKVGISDYVLVSVTQGKGIDTLLDQLLNLLPNLKKRQADSLSLKLAIIGRPNVGKSYLFNSLAKKQQAVVSDRAGTTRDINRSRIKYHSKDIEVMDTAGMRRPSKPTEGVEYFSALRTISAIEQSDICLLLMDSTEYSVNLDQRLAGIIKEAGKGLILAVSKWDLISEQAAEQRERAVNELKAAFGFVPWAPLIFTSALTGQNVTKIYELALEIEKNRSRKIPTSELNKWLKVSTSRLSPKGLKNRQPKLNYMVQETDNKTPSFKIFGAHTRYLHFSYKRYLERQLRESYEFTGTPIQLWFIEKNSHSLTRST